MILVGKRKYMITAHEQELADLQLKNYSREEIAEMKGISVGGVDQILHKYRRKVKCLQQLKGVNPW
jgi:DNA-directed RNA polymerase specialized sigma24 family protein